MPTASETPELTCILAFNAGGQLAVRRLGSKVGLAFSGSDLPMAHARLSSAFAESTPPRERFDAEAGGRCYRVHLAQVSGSPCDPEIEFWSLERLEQSAATLAPSLAGLIAGLEPYLIELPYFHLEESDFIYKFRPEKERNAAIYAQDAASGALYQSELCSAIKALASRIPLS